jgi:ribosomal protein S12 methylthiotransferase
MAKTWEKLMHLAALIRALGEIEDIEWVRVMYAYPTHISDGFLAAIAETPKSR